MWPKHGSRGASAGDDAPKILDGSLLPQFLGAGVPWRASTVMYAPHRSALAHPATRASLKLLFIAATICSTAGPARAVPLSSSDFSLALYAASGSSWTTLGSGSVGDYFGPHRCNCPATLSAALQITSQGQTDIGSSTIGVNFLLGANCLASPSSCLSVGKVTFSATQSTDSPTFDSSLVFQSAADSSSVSCGSLTTGATTLWAVMTQDGVALNFSPTMALAIITGTAKPPTAVTALPANQGLQVSWTPPSDTSLVAGYQVLCLPRPAAAATAGYESCGLVSVTGAAVLTPADVTQVCSAEVSATTTSVHLTGLVNGTSYTVAVVAIDPSGGVSVPSPSVVAMPQPTKGFYEKYKEAGGTATGCSLASGGSPWWMCVGLAALLGIGWRGRRRRNRLVKTVVVLACALAGSAHAQNLQDTTPMPSEHWTSQPRAASDDWAANPSPSSNDWAVNSSASADVPSPDWGLEVGFSPYRPDVDSEFSNGAHPFGDTFSGHQLMSEVELDRYLRHGLGSWGAGLRVGYLRATGSAFLEDGVTRSGDETSLRIIPFSLSALYRADGIPGLWRAALVPYVKAGLDLAMWTAKTTGGVSHTGLTPGWHAAVGLSLGLNLLGFGPIRRGEIAGPGALFFEWDWAALDGLGLSNRLHLGDSTWYAGLVFDL
jgi:hypothetical protein